ncbi:condensation domain-containing protein [Amycolatopsis sp. DSM 110486]|uniref:condensation domain-containing protein n=1 Tax=Amycolatopsis sp. DSM 110486 TaxID=2865832 RepID=UPI001C69FAFA|nr:condensation domain-containing protein [Amycolatopsis sp. DSM 110486]QYN17776.1 hypothetical protein K1T34_33935 [Amycolatopsis sp. DSM 110486]
MKPSGTLTGPLTFGQLSCWRDVEFHPRHRWHEPNGAELWPVPVPVSTDRVRAAFDVVAARHDSLRTTYDLTDKKNPTQTVNAPGGPLDVEVVTAERAELGEVADEAAREPFDLRSDFSWRARIVTDGFRAGHIVFANHHITADAFSRRLLCEEVLAELTGPGAPAPAEAAYHLVDLANEQRSEKFRAKHDAALRHWERMLTATYATPAPAGAGGGPFAEHDSPVLLAALSSETARVAAQETADRLGVSLSSVLLSAYLVAAGHVHDTWSLPVRLISSNRFSARLQQYVTSLNSWAPTQVDAEPGEPFDDVIVRVNQLGLQAYRLGVYDLDRVAELRTRVTAAGSEPESVWSFNFFTTDAAIDPLDDTEPRITWAEPFHAIGPRFYLRAIDHGKAGVTFRLRARDTTAEHVRGVLLGMHALLHGRRFPA